MLSQDVERYIEELVEAYPKIDSIWLFGSRANKTGHDKSDWDFFVFGTLEILQLLENDKSFHNPFIDLLIIYNGENFKDPGGKGKNGSLTEWGWKEIDESTATYIESKPDHLECGRKSYFPKKKTCNAIRIYTIT